MNLLLWILKIAETSQKMPQKGTIFAASLQQRLPNFVIMIPYPQEKVKTFQEPRRVFFTVEPPGRLDTG